MYKQNNKILLWPTSLLVACFVAWHYDELLWSLERNSFFSFSFDFLRAFLAGGNQLPGLDIFYPVPQLIGAFFLQFYKGWGVYVTFSLLCAGFSVMASLCSLHFLKRLFPKQAAWFAILFPLFGFLWAGVWCWLALSPIFPFYFAYTLLLSLFVFFLSGKLPTCGRLAMGSVWLILSFSVTGGLCSLCFLVAMVIREAITFRPTSGVWLFIPFLFGIAIQANILHTNHLSIQKGLVSDLPNFHNRLPHPVKFFLLVKQTERLCLEERYADALEFADAYWFSHPCPISDVMNGQNTFYAGLSEDEIIFRLRLASYTKTALIGSGNLVSRFFSYYRIPEIYNLHNDLRQIDFSLESMLRQRALENPTATYYIGVNLLDYNRFSYANLRICIPSMLASYQYGLANKYIRILQGTLFYGKDADRWLELSNSIQIDSIQRNPSSRATLDCLLLDRLLSKDLMGASSLIPSYIRLNENFPRPLQELICIMQREMFPISDSVQTFLKDMPVDESVERNFRRFLHDFSLWLQGQKTTEELTAEYGHTYPYYYYLIY